MKKHQAQRTLKREGSISPITQSPLESYMRDCYEIFSDCALEIDSTSRTRLKAFLRNYGAPRVRKAWVNFLEAGGRGVSSFFDSQAALAMKDEKCGGRL